MRENPREKERGEGKRARARARARISVWETKSREREGKRERVRESLDRHTLGVPVLFFLFADYTLFLHFFHFF